MRIEQCRYICVRKKENGYDVLCVDGRKKHIWEDINLIPPTAEIVEYSTYYRAESNLAKILQNDEVDGVEIKNAYKRLYC